MAPMIRQLPPAYGEAVTLADPEGVSQADEPRGLACGPPE